MLWSGRVSGFCWRRMTGVVERTSTLRAWGSSNSTSREVRRSTETSLWVGSAGGATVSILFAVLAGLAPASSFFNGLGILISAARGSVLRAEAVVEAVVIFQGAVGACVARETTTAWALLFGRAK